MTQCIKLANSSQKQDCLVALAIQMANRDQNMAYCRQIPTSYVTEGLLCNNLASRSFNKPMVEQHDNIIQHQQNMLLIRNTDGSLSEKAAEFGVDKSFWSWNAKAADLDNDEWQDLYVGNGYEFGTANNEIHSNVFFHNQMGKGFKQAEKEFGLTDYVNTTNYSYADIDLDGDLDIIANGTMSAPRVFLNQNQNNSITFSLRDDIGNHFCIGCKATIYYGDNKRQIRELLLSGGFQSFDEPVIHFGLASYEQINRIDINWSTGETTTISEPLKANRRYRIYRNSNVRNIAAR